MIRSEQISRYVIHNCINNGVEGGPHILVWAVLLLHVNARTHDVLDHGLYCVVGGVCGYATYCWGDAAILFVNLKCLHLNHMLLISVRGGRRCLRQVRDTCVSGYFSQTICQADNKAGLTA